MELLTRQHFGEQVFARDKHRCVVCGSADDLDAHHVMDRGLFENGGYYASNGVSLCPEHHLAAEKGELLPDELRDLAGITEVVLPPNLTKGVAYNKWGELLPFMAKYPVTKHVPWGKKVDDEDEVLTSMDHFKDREVVVTEKLDGENTNSYWHGYFHARSLNARKHPSQTWVKNLLSQVTPQIPSGWRLCGENMCAVHTIQYDELPSYFFVYQAYEESNICLSWDDMGYFLESVASWPKLMSVPVLYRGVYDEAKVKACFTGKSVFGGIQEGYVVRATNAFKYDDFNLNVAKYVGPLFKRAIKDSTHWWSKPFISQKLAVQNGT